MTAKAQSQDPRFLPQLMQSNTVHRPQQVTLSVMRVKSLPPSKGLCEDKTKRLKDAPKTLWTHKEPF